MNIQWHRIPSNTNTVVQKAPPTSVVKEQQMRSFKEELRHQIESMSQLKVSKHAAKRLATRALHISPGMWERIEHKVDEARQKGVNDSLVLTPDVAMIVSAKNHTVITAMGREEAQDQIFTNIDGTIVLN